MSDHKEKDNGPKLTFNGNWLYAIIAVALLFVYLLRMMGGQNENISFDRFAQMASKGDVERVEVINEKYAHVYLKPEALKKNEYKEVARNNYPATRPHYVFNIGPPEAFARQIQELNAHLPKGQQVPVQYDERSNWLGNVVGWLFPILLIVGLWVFILRRMGNGGSGAQIFNIGKSKATLFDKDAHVDVTFEQVAGLEEAREEVMEVVDFLKNPKKYTALGGKIPKGVLLFGPPGTGKTLLAKAVAGEAGVPFFTISGSDFVEMFVGVGASRVRDLFRQAREKAPCIIFIDEIDAIGRARGKGFQGGNAERESTLNQLLVEMDGFTTDKGVILIAATNRPDVLDSALLRPGRFDRQIGIDRPDLKGRAAIFKVHLQNIELAKDVDAEHLAEMTPGFAGAEIANVCNEAALVAARRNKKAVDMEDFNYALDRVIGGLEKKNMIISPKEKEIIAYHEAGHAICGWFLEHASPLVKVTIVPRGMGTLGYAQYLPKEEYITRYEQLLDRLCMTFGGRAAEQVVFGKISTGAQNDLDQVTKIAYSMVTVFGMSKEVGQVSFHSLMEEQFQKPFSEDTARLIDEQVRKILDEQYQRAIELLKKYRNELELLARQLLEKEVLLKSDLERLIGPRPCSADEKEAPINEPAEQSEDQPDETESEE